MGFRGGGGSSFQTLMPLTPVVRLLIYACVGIWFFGVVIAEQYLMSEKLFTHYFGLVPLAITKSFFIWQPITYFFLHSTSPLHIIFNMLLLWWLGSELERLWGSKFFAIYYFVCGIGAAIIYVVTIAIYAKVSGNLEPMIVPVVGASGAVFGLMVAFGILFGERVVYFMMFFPMKAKVFVAILGGIEIVMILNEGLSRGGVANLAHLGGIITGFIFLRIGPWIMRRRGGGKGKGRKNPGLRLVVSNDDVKNVEKPKYWN